MILHACEMALQAAGAEELQCIANARRDFGVLRDFGGGEAGPYRQNQSVQQIT